MSNLIEKTKQLFSPTILGRGKQYFLENRIIILTQTKKMVEARVNGSTIYSVQIINSEADYLQADCNCPYFEDDYTPCKHIWATLLEADKNNWAPSLSGKKSLIEFDVIPERIFEESYDDFLDEDDEDEELYEEQYEKAFQKKKKQALKPNWSTLLNSINGFVTEKKEKFPKDTSQLIYVINITPPFHSKGIYIQLFEQKKKKNGEFGVPQQAKIKHEDISNLPHPLDKDLLSILVGSQPDTSSYHYPHYSNYMDTHFDIPDTLQQKVLSKINETGRGCIRQEERNKNFDTLFLDKQPWMFNLEATKVKTNYQLDGFLVRNDQKIPITTPLSVYSGGIIIWKDFSFAYVKNLDSFPWIAILAKEGSITIPKKEQEAFLNSLHSIPLDTTIHLPPELQLKKVFPKPKKKIYLYSDESDYQNKYLRADVEFNYNTLAIPFFHSQQKIVAWKKKELIHREHNFELNTHKELLNLGFTVRQLNLNTAQKLSYFQLHSSRSEKSIQSLLANHWEVKVEGKAYRSADSFSMKVSSGIDWFELHGFIQYGEEEFGIPALLKALKKNKGFITLKNGDLGLLPDKWLEQYAPLIDLGEAKSDHIQFKSNQSMLIDALIADLPVKVDATFSKIRKNLQGFKGLKPVTPLKSFNGTLREYQKEGLSWFFFLQKFGLGGCLADDMGLGKTVQLLALLDKRKRNTNKNNGPFLIIMPKSLIFNWTDEILKFTSNTKVLNYTGLGRKVHLDNFHDYHVILTTYGTMRRDIHQLKNQSFDYVVLDEAQAIKNASSQSAKAVRLLKAKHRLALSGTPVENHLGDLWSLFEFLNPGMMGRVSLFNKIKNDESRSVLKKALTPFILRRTKTEVAKELPEKTEQVIYCDLVGKQKQHYEELKKHYQQSLLDNKNKGDVKKNKIQVLEALLRLRQTACHPGLVNPSLQNESNSKLDILQEQLLEVVEEGHKVLVFSQFTSLLKLFKKRLDETKTPYLYLDGKTNKRKELVTRFQEDKEMPVFLISLKAGGVGLNLTAADYVYILDPWWNPAVEAQAIDRAHRIGQKKPVFAYKLITRGTVEEKVLELQNSKKKLMKDVINEDTSIIKNLTKDELSFLLS